MKQYFASVKIVHLSFANLVVFQLYILDFLKALQNGETILIAEGYVREFGRRGYLKMGPFIPEVVLDHPELLKNMHEEFVHAGSDVVQAFTVSCSTF